MARKLIIDKASIIGDMKSIVPSYLQIDPSDSLNSAFGILTMNQATSIDDTYKLALARSADSILELSDNLSKLRMGAAIFQVPIERVTPGTTMCTLHIAIDDVINKGTTAANGDISFLIDKRSEIIHDGVYFSLPDTVLIRAIKSANSGYFYTAEFQSIDPSLNPMSLQKIVIEGADKLQITSAVYQYKINSVQKTIMDKLEFSTEGLLFEYENAMAGFDVYYRTSAASKFLKANMVYHIVDTITDSSLRYNDDKDGELYILNSYTADLPENTELRVDIKESLGVDGMINLGQRTTEFRLYQDADYNLLSVNIDAVLLMDPINAKNQDSAADIRKKLIRRKFERFSLITEADIRNFINSEFANTQLVPRKNDFKSTEHSLYTLLKINNVVAPTTTLNLKIFQEEFDIYHNISGRRILKSNSAFKVIDNPNSMTQKIATIPDSAAMATLEADKNQLCLNFPFVLAVTPEPLCKIFMNTIKQTLTLQSAYQNEDSILKFAVRDINFQRNSMSSDYDTYRITATLIPNSIGDSKLINEEGVIDHTQLKVFMIFKSDGVKKAYLPMTITAVDPIKNLVDVSGFFKTDDFITQDSKLKITSGMKLVGETVESELVIDYHDSKFEMVMFTNNLPTNISHEYYGLIPNMSTYQIANASENKDQELDLLIDLNNFMNCNIRVIQENGKTGYIISELPFIKYSYCKDNIFEILTQVSKMKTLYSELSARLVGKTLNLKFIRTYGKSKYIKIGNDGLDLGNINPVLAFDIYGDIASFQEIRNYITTYFEAINDLDKGVIYMSNICREIERNYLINSCIATGIDAFTEVNPIIRYEKPNKETTPELYAAYIPEYMCIANIVINNKHIE